jgi:predicted acetyltransferase
MTPEAQARRARVDVVRAEPADRALIEGLFQFYVYDFSEFQAAESPDFDLNGEARFDPYPALDQYWSDPACIPLLIRFLGRPVGFALVNAFAHSGGVCDHSMAEFFVMRKYRREAVGAIAVSEILQSHPGRWEVAIARRNDGALAFWPRVLGLLGCVRDLKTVEMDEALWRGPVLLFEAVAAS